MTKTKDSQKLTFRERIEALKVIAAARAADDQPSHQGVGPEPRWLNPNGRARKSPTEVIFTRL